MRRHHNYLLLVLIFSMVYVLIHTATPIQSIGIRQNATKQQMPNTVLLFQPLLSTEW
jgi:hypothetical protein